jgi:hypothetical protein
METRIGKIKRAIVGMGGYQDAMFGVSFDLGSDKDSWGVSDFWGAWAPSIKVTEYTKWTEADRAKQLSDAFTRLAQLMLEAKVSDVNKLAGFPIEVKFDGHLLKSWRVLTEVI